MDDERGYPHLRKPPCDECENHGMEHIEDMELRDVTILQIFIAVTAVKFYMDEYIMSKR